MSLYVQQFFDSVVTLPFDDHAVVGNSYYATPHPDSPLRLRIDFAPTIRHGEYDGLRLRVIHPNQGVLDTAILPFADHGTFARRDAARDLAAGKDGYAVFRDWNGARTGEPPWKGAQGTGLRTAIRQYALIWFPDASAPASARPTAARTVLPAIAPGTGVVRTR
ncbi:hypothetical protein [Streptomyces chattanoogensis]|uniref:Uncharacterized protein n=1 Tax=Streptomyces chattanoogensis TaxID=66876 RepID=A0A0N0GZC9_9ACTN|nr:hypothetical protein [Streptomyces chattanoogensis]KPC62632.1 hypothetical protein ADL29_17930 [Streptomyces chattanoogensis]